MTFNDVRLGNNYREARRFVRRERQYSRQETKAGLAFANGTSRSPKAMKRLREAVAAIPDQDLADHIKKIVSSVDTEEFARLETWVRKASRQENCTYRFAFGLALRHTATSRYPGSQDSIRQTIVDIMKSKTLTGTLLS